jgi:hypothetical protein
LGGVNSAVKDGGDGRVTPGHDGVAGGHNPDSQDEDEFWR